jgi:predicted aldo/keto reductase-like oxidoreductase
MGDGMTDRRGFLRAGAAAAVALAGVDAVAQTAGGAPRIQRYKRLGRTGLKVSDISFGSASSSDEALVRYALSRGVNYFDSAESYRWGGAEEAIGAALERRRSEAVISTKTKAGASDKRADMMKALEGSLNRLGTDHIDIYFNHSVDDVERVRNPEWREFTELAKRQGKIRFRGMSGHGSALVKCLDYAIDNDLVDVILCSYSFAQDPSFTDKLRHTFHWAAIQADLTRVLAKAKQKDIGVLAMKALMGARLNDMRPFERPGGTFAQAAFRWVLSNPNVDALLISMTSPQLIDEYVAASGATKVGAHDLELLSRYADLRLGNYCMPGCNACQESCPQDVRISEVLRTRMYDVDYGDRALARSEYAQLGAAAAACASCSHQACLNACPAGVPIAQFTREAAARLG